MIIIDKMSLLIQDSIYIFTKRRGLIMIQFSCQFPDVVEFSEEMASLGKTVIIAALDGTFQRRVSLAG